jgi:hypothetical protein
MKNRFNSVYMKVRGIPFISEFFEKTTRQVMPSQGKSWTLMFAEFRGQWGGGGGYIHTHNSVEFF